MKKKIICLSKIALKANKHSSFSLFFCILTFEGGGAVGTKSQLLPKLILEAPLFIIIIVITDIICHHYSRVAKASSNTL